MTEANWISGTRNPEFKIQCYEGGVSAKAMASWAGTEMEAYGKAGAVAEEALGAIREI